MKRSLIEALPNQIAGFLEKAFSPQPSSYHATPHCTASQKLEFMKPNARAMRIMSKSRNDRGSRELW